MYRRAQRINFNLKAMSGVVALALALFASSSGTLLADGSGNPAKTQVTPSIIKPAADVINKGRTKPKEHPLSTQQKRIFVLGLGASQKN